MEKITYIIFNIGQDMCRITCNDIRTQFSKYAEGACICDLTTLMYEMQSISNACRMNHVQAVFEFCGDF